MSGRPSAPRDALSPEDLQRFIHACSRERRSPTTHRMIDAASYGWVHQLIRDNEESATPAPGGDWLDTHGADPAKLEAFFGRVAIRLRNTAAFDYATTVQDYFHGQAETRPFP